MKAIDSFTEEIEGQTVTFVRIGYAYGWYVVVGGEYLGDFRITEQSGKTTAEVEAEVLGALRDEACIAIKSIKYDFLGEM